jgi:DNA-binding NarL/FixJ family response regulator
MKTLRQLFRDGVRNADIATILDRTEASISAQLSLMRRRRLLGPAEQGAG